MPPSASWHHGAMPTNAGPPQPRVDTAARAQNAYSYVQTPIEFEGGSRDELPPMPTTTLATMTTTTDNRDADGDGNKAGGPADNKANNERPTSMDPEKAVDPVAREIELARQLRQQSIITAGSHSSLDLTAQHPAFSAPYVHRQGSPRLEPTGNSQPPLQQPLPPSQSSSPPLDNKEQSRPSAPPTNIQPISIQPDINPLQATRRPTMGMGRTRTNQSGNQPNNRQSLGPFPDHVPGQVTHPDLVIQGGTWSSGLCDCSPNPGTCCLGLACPCMLYGRTQYRLARKSRREDPTNLLGYEKCNGSCVAMALLCGCQWLLATIQHTRTRKAYDIEGDIVTDCLHATYCTCCTLIRDEREIRIREETRAETAQMAVSTMMRPYAVPEQMVYPTSN